MQMRSEPNERQFRRATICRGWQPRSPGNSTEERRPDEFAHPTGAGTRNVVEHVRDEETNNLVGYFGDDPGDPVIVPAGSIACFSTTVFHRSVWGA
jgi:hypothetical protein